MTFNKADSNTVVPWELTGIFVFFKDCELSLTPKQEIDRFIYLPKIYCKSPVGYTCCFLFIQKYRQIIIIIRDNKIRLDFISCWLYLVYPFLFDIFSYWTLSTFSGLGTSSLRGLFPKVETDLSKWHTMVVTNLAVWLPKSIFFSLGHVLLLIGLV